MLQSQVFPSFMMKEMHCIPRRSITLRGKLLREQDRDMTQSHCSQVCPDTERLLASTKSSSWFDMLPEVPVLKKMHAGRKN